ncbi:31933_t:CDS:2 [Gigaspora margarita]|uniref:31933_t:CDS:1 n=1 Tax=Gigaspora margarita TaxID=4874 RepID=A0ABM8W2V2_GIGMA|nr:31933_t:CDS:2 [Gigaspora margarita]
MLELKMEDKKVREGVRQIDERGIQDRYRGYYFEVMLERALASKEESSSPLMMLENGVGRGSM